MPLARRRPLVSRFLLRFGTGRDFLRRLWSSWPMERVVRTFRTPERLDDYMQVCFEYVRDDLEFGVDDHWKPPRLTFESRRGDCEDFALFARHVLRHHGYQPRIFAAFTKDVGHAVCVYRDGGAWYLIDDEGVRRIARVALGEEDEALARRTADVIYPDGWSCCSWVDRYEEGDPDAGGREPLLPYYEWIYPA